ARGLVAGRGREGGVPVNGFHGQAAALAVEAGIDPADPRAAAQNGEDVGAVLPLRLGHVHLEPVVEAEQLFGAVAVVDKPVERREEGDTSWNRAVGGIWMRHPFTGLEADAERSEALVGQPPLRLGQRYRLRLGIPTLGEVPETLSPAPADDGDVSAPVEDVEHHADVTASVPAARLPGSDRMVVELA